MRTLLALPLLVALFGCALAQEDEVTHTSKNCVNGRCIVCIDGKCHLGTNPLSSDSTVPLHFYSTLTNILISSARLLRNLSAAHVDLEESIAASSARRLRSW
ncbi:hypothetical protein PMAYCL1PPCAC_14634 [Pristionchus mayeri]|uniref:Uncharacterized protein n=1 Tax=Pristionchus mayeri TaxID=1317129 RepID=A0AAN4ZR01_9BILA|nr:hypothetical protein PMAYCL1PPCAC_14634 [Pristionchus mayeri]